ncbi:MAG: flagellar assembly protein FliW [Deltaproteobacteria bacterium]|nr:flagellar assembly protein FliW [Deltaproteobacteria bacterium]
MSDSQVTATIRTNRFGEIAYDPDKALYFPGGLLGFPDSARYVVLDHEEDSPFKWLQSIDETELAFVIADPLVFFPDYKAHIRKEELASLNIHNLADAVVFVILSLHGTPMDMTANLQGPIIVNAESRVGRQFVLKESDYKTKHPLFPDLAPPAKA